MGVCVGPATPHSFISLMCAAIAAWSRPVQPATTSSSTTASTNRVFTRNAKLVLITILFLICVHRCSFAAEFFAPPTPPPDETPSPQTGETARNPPAPQPEPPIAARDPNPPRYRRSSAPAA